MRNEVFVDTSGWLCFSDIAQPQHVWVRRFIERHLDAGGALISTSDVLTELLPLLSSRMRASRKQILEFVVQLNSLPSLEIIHISPETHRQAFELLRARPDKEWSWVDAASFVVMQERASVQVLTTDHHFDQAGFQKLIK